MKTLIVILVVLAVVMFATRPSAEKHKTAIAERLVALSQQQGPALNDSAIVCWDLKGLNGREALNVDSVAQEVGKQLEVKNFWLCSVGSLKRDGKQQHVSLGVCGHVFCTGLKP